MTGTGRAFNVTVVETVAVEMQPLASFTTKVFTPDAVTASVFEDTNPVPFQL